jgi:hypothetical protein
MLRPLFDRATELLREAMDASGLERQRLIVEALRLHRLSLETEGKQDPLPRQAENIGSLSNP